MYDSKRATRDMLVRGRGFIAARGLIKKSYGGPRVGFCTVGALRYACHGSTEYPSLMGTEPSARAAYLEALGLLANCARTKQILLSVGFTDAHFNANSIASFNDADSTTQEDVLKLYDDALVMISAEMVVA